MSEKRFVKRMRNVYESNKSSQYTEEMERLYKSFNYEENSRHNWTYPEFSLLYGSPIYENASEDQRRVLNHLYWICFYNYVMGGEISTMVGNQLCCGAFYHLGGYEVICHELDLETSQERIHVEAFRHVGHETEMALFGKLIFRRPLPSYLDGALSDPQNNKRSFFHRLPQQVLHARIASSPFLATQYFTGRGLRNIQAKVKEYQHSLYGKERERNGEFVCSPTMISHNHCFDEGFHTSTSKFISHDLMDDLGQPSSMDAYMANRLVRGVQSSLDNLACTVPGIFSDDSQYIPLIYEMLQTDIFGMTQSEALDALEQTYCQEHEGFHVAAKYHSRALKQNREFVSDLEYLNATNRDLKVMASASIDKTIANNISVFRRLRQEMTKNK